MNAVTEIAPLVGIVLACTTLAVGRATYYRALRPHAVPPPPRTRREALVRIELVGEMRDAGHLRRARR